jgi:hypothetical protein
MRGNTTLCAETWSTICATKASADQASTKCGAETHKGRRVSSLNQHEAAFCHVLLFITSDERASAIGSAGCKRDDGNHHFGVMENSTFTLVPLGSRWELSYCGQSELRLFRRFAPLWHADCIVFCAVDQKAKSPKRGKRAHHVMIE